MRNGIALCIAHVKVMANGAEDGSLYCLHQLTASSYILRVDGNDFGKLNVNICVIVMQSIIVINDAINIIVVISPHPHPEADPVVVFIDEFTDLLQPNSYLYQSLYQREVKIVFQRK